MNIKDVEENLLNEPFAFKMTLKMKKQLDNEFGRHKAKFVRDSIEKSLQKHFKNKGDKQC